MSADRALILDFGGVISRTLFETHAMTEAALGLPSGSLKWRGPFSPGEDPLWQDMRAGRITERGYWAARTHEVGAMIGADWGEMSDFVRAARGAEPEAVIRPEALAAIDEVREAGHALAILSNELDLFYGADFREKLPFLTNFDVIVDATYTGILKPDPRAYAEVVGRLGLPATACVFLDDQPKNVAGGSAAGLISICFDVTAPGDSYAAALGALHSIERAG